ncbi:acyl-CoA dehydrogenase family protein [Paraburkholderia sp. IMGN_8]|uniref:acyl-CoA dehydrogenase family protein n=1 Tax=Paraburkholderia sp. IMGN_8 TaxID=3136564 RepID=UPI003100CCBF
MSTLAPEAQHDEIEHTELSNWLDSHANALDLDQSRAGEVLPALAHADIFRTGVPIALGGSGGTIATAIESVIGVAQHSLTAAFVLWGHRTFIEYVVQSSNSKLRDRWLPPLLAGEIAGASGLSNAMKYLSSIELLQMRASRTPTGWSLSGNLPWITNLRREGFLAAAAFEDADGAPASIFAIPHNADGVQRSDDLELIGMRASNTAALRLEGTTLDDQYRITDDARTFLTQVRPAFLGLQCGMSIGLARRALAAVADAGAGSRTAIQAEANDTATKLTRETGQLLVGVTDGHYLRHPSHLFELRIALANTVNSAVSLEVQAAGGRGYLCNPGDTARRVREASFIPIVTPSLVQLKTQLELYRTSL